MTEGRYETWPHGTWSAGGKGSPDCTGVPHPRSTVLSLRPVTPKERYRHTNHGRHRGPLHERLEGGIDRQATDIARSVAIVSDSTHATEDL